MFSSTFIFLGEPVSFSADADDIEILEGKTKKAEKNLRPDGNGLVQFQAAGVQSGASRERSCEQSGKEMGALMGAESSKGALIVMRARLEK